MHPDPYTPLRIVTARQILDVEHQRRFTDLYNALRAAFPHPFDWLDYLECPPWWHLRARRAHREVAWIFACHGLLLTPGQATEFLYCTEGQQHDEDVGGAIIRRLRTVFQWQTGARFRGLSVIDGGLRDGW